MEKVYYELAIIINKKLYQNDEISYKEYIKKEKDLFKEINR